MGALGYLFFTRIKNTLLGALKKPARLIMILVFAALIGFTVFAGDQASDASELRDINELFAIIFALYFSIALITMLNGLNRGASFFSMADVNMLFPAPVSSRKILLYGMLRQLGTIFFMGFFILFQYGWMHTTYGVSFGFILLVLAFFIGVIFCAQLTALVVYSITNGSDEKRRLARIIILAVAAASVIFCIWPYVANFAGDSSITALATAASRPAVNYIPIAGWMRALLVGTAQGELGTALLGAGLTVAYIGAFLALLLGVNAEYYEDVLSATETSFSAITAQKEGKLQENTPNKIRVGKVGLGRGQGAWAFYFKHLIENRRASVIFIEPTNLIYYGMAILFAFIFNDSIYFAFGMSLYFMLFETFTSRWVRELLLPFIYMVPEPPFKKLVALSAESVRKNALLSIGLMVIIGIITKANPLVVAALTLIRICFSLLIISCNFLADRLFGSIPGRTMQFLLFFLVVIVVAIPGVVGMVFLLMFAGELIGLLAMALWLFLASALITFLCRNILTYSELNNQ